MKVKYIFFLSVLSIFVNASFSQTSNFSASTTNICEDVSVQFNDLSTGTITSWFWDFGDGNSSTSANPIHVYTSAGTYTVSLTINGGADIEIKTNYITVFDAPDILLTTSGNTSCSIPLNVTFNNTTSGSGITFNWVFGDGGTSTSASPTHLYSTFGTFNTVLSAFNGTCTSTDTQVIILQNFQADFIGLPIFTCLNDTVSFVDASSHPSQTWNWNFGDGNTSTLQNPINIYSTTGTYDVQLIATSTIGCVDTMIKSDYIVVNPLPVISFVVDDDSSCYAPFNTSFTYTGDPLLIYNWNFGDGGTSFLSNPTHTYSSIGTYDVTLTGTDGNGCTSSLTQPAFIKIIQTQAAISSNVINGCEDLNVQFTDISTSLDPIVSWNWSFGDGGTSSTQDPNYTYLDTGSFPVQLIVSTSTGCVDTAVYLIEVGMPPIVDIAPPFTIGCHPLTVTFTDLSSSYSDAWSWNFGDGNTSSVQNPTNVYTADTGYFDVTLTASFHGCPTTVFFNDAVYVKQAKPIFSVDSLIDCFAPYIITFDDTSKGAEQWTWKFGDGNSSFFPVGSPSADVSHTYLLPGSYTVWLIVENFTQNCIDSLSALIRISDLDPGFTVDTTATCQPNPITFTDTSFGTFLPFSWNWASSDGATSASQNIIYDFAGISGIYDITLTVTDGLGCTKSEVKPGLIDIKPLPVVGFMPFNIDGCAPLNTNFTDTSSSVVPINTWIWNYGDGSLPDTVQDGSNIYFNTGVYSITLTVIDDNNCQNSMVASNMVNVTFPIPDFSAPLFGCSYDSITFTNNSSGADITYTWDFNDGSSTVSDINPTHIFSSASGIVMYPVNLTVTDSNGCTDQLSKFITISKPVANFTIDTNFSECPPLTVTFTDLSILDIAARDWNYGDGSTGNDTISTHTYTSPGIYDVQLIVTDQYGCRDTILKPDTIEVQGVSGTATAIEDTSSCGQTFAFNFNTTAGINVIYSWLFGDGNTSTEQNPVHLYATTGEFIPSITVTDQNNCSLSFILDTVVSSVTQTFSVDVTSNIAYAGINQEIQFSASTSNTVSVWNWNFGDGDTESNAGASVSHEYTTQNTYLVSVIGIADNGCTGSDTISITIYDNTNRLGNVFTPNGDGINDVFTIYNNGAKSHELSIYNRWGELLFYGLAPQVEWYGKDFAGSDVPSGTYYYILITTDISGNITEYGKYVTVLRN